MASRLGLIALYACKTLYAVCNGVVGQPTLTLRSLQFRHLEGERVPFIPRLPAAPCISSLNPPLFPITLSPTSLAESVVIEVGWPCSLLIGPDDRMQASMRTGVSADS